MSQILNTSNIFQHNVGMRPSYTRRPSSRESSSSSDSSSEEDCKVYGTDDDEQEDPKDYRKGDAAVMGPTVNGFMSFY